MPPLGESISEIIDRTTKIVHEEIELAKAEMAVALQDLLRGSVAGIVGGVFAFFGLFILLIAFSFLIADAIGVLYPWLGFFIVAFVCFAVGGVLAWIALKKIKKGSQLAPSQAIDEAKQTRDALQQEPEVETIDAVAVEEPAGGQTVEATVVKPATPAGASASAKPAEPAVVEAEVVEEANAADGGSPQAPAAEPAAAESVPAAAAETAAVEQLAQQGGSKREAKRAAKQARAAAKAAVKAEKRAAKERAKQQKAAAKDSSEAAEQADAEPAAEKQVPTVEAPAYTPPQPPEDPTGGQ